MSVEDPTASGARPPHRVHFYADPAELIGVVGPPLLAHLAAGGAAVILARPDAVRALRERGGAGLVLRDAGEMLAKVEAAGGAAALRAVLEAEGLGARLRGGFVYSELVDIAAARGDFEEALRLERAWDELARAEGCELHCGYRLSRLASGPRSADVDAGRDLDDPGGAEAEPARLLALLRQRNAALEHEADRCRRMEARLALLARAGDVLSVTLDRERTLRSVIELALPALGDFGFFDVLESDGEVRRLARAHEDPRRQAILDQTRWVRSERTDMNLCALSSGKPAIHAPIGEEWLGRVAVGPEHLAVMRDLGFCSMITVPLRVEGRVLGALTLFHAASGRLHTADDLALAEELAHRAAAAVANSQLYRELQEAVRRKDEFLAMLGHELRNPLAPIITALELMDMQGDPTSYRERQIIRRQAEHLTRLVDDLLDVSRLTKGKIQLRRQTVEVAAVVAQAIEMTSPLLEERAHTLAVDVARTGLRVDADPVRLAQVVSNLLSNAARYTPAGGRIAVRARRDGELITVDIEDNGIGIAPQMLGEIFELFAQGGAVADSAAADRREGGLGLGLPLARSLAELHDGALSAASPGPGQGSTFTLQIPAASVTAGDATQAPVEAAAAPEGLAILVVDDNEDAAETLAELLRAFGHGVAVAFDGVQALAQAQLRPFDLALLDIGLPVMDGFELARRLRDLPRPPARLVALTGYGQEQDKARAVAAGFHDHLVKPVDLDRLLAALAGPT